MVLTPLADVAPADWLVHSQDEWQSLVSLGPSDFEAHVRLFHGPASMPPDEVDQLVGRPPDDLLRRLHDVLAEHTTTPDECFYGLWDGYGDLHGSPSVAVATEDGTQVVVPPAFPSEVMAAPRVRVPNRDYLLFAGPLADAGDWGAAPVAPGWPRRELAPPTLMWPADRAWFVASEIDLPWTGVAGTRRLVEVLEGRGFDLERAGYGGYQPFWRTGG